MMFMSSADIVKIKFFLKKNLPGLVLEYVSL